MHPNLKTGIWCSSVRFARPSLGFMPKKDSFLFLCCSECSSWTELIEEHLPILFCLYSSKCTEDPRCLYCRVLLIFGFGYVSVLRWQFWCWTHQASCERSHLQILFRYHSAILLEHQQCIEISSLRIMLLVKPYPANTYFPFSWSGNQLESILALNLWQIFSLYIS